MKHWMEMEWKWIAKVYLDSRVLIFVKNESKFRFSTSGSCFHACTCVHVCTLHMYFNICAYVFTLVHGLYIHTFIHLLYISKTVLLYICISNCANCDKLWLKSFHSIGPSIPKALHPRLPALPPQPGQGLNLWLSQA